MFGKFYVSALALFFSLLMTLQHSALAQDDDEEEKPKKEKAESVDPDDPYRRKDVAAARFGSADMQKYLKAAYEFQDTVNQSIFGQEHATKVVQDRLVQYLENFGSRNGEPIALHLVGLPGIGKSAMLNHLIATKIPVVRMDVQHFLGPEADFANSVIRKIREAGSPDKPVILLVEEIDKLPELAQEGRGVGEEKTHNVIGVLNTILSEGKLSQAYGRSIVDFSNVMVMTSLNFSPREIEDFSREALGERKSFYEFTVEDFQKFNEWVQTQEAARYKVLARLFRSNTVSRLAPNTVILQPLTRENYKSIAEANVKAAIKRTQEGQGSQKRLSVGYSESFLDFVVERTIFAPSGARETVMRSDALTEQLIGFGMRAQSVGDDSLSAPRRLEFDYRGDGETVVIKVTPRKLHNHRDWVDGKSFEITARYDAASRSFLEPEGLAIVAPHLRSRAAEEEKEKPLTKKEIRETRFPVTQKKAKGLADYLNERIVGQRITATIENEMNNYLGRSGAAPKEPSAMIFSGFPGIGKSELVRLTGQYLKLPVIKVNMQGYTADDPNTVASFLEAIEKAVDEARVSEKSGRYILQIEELDKVYEIHPQTGVAKDRPIMAVIKDLLNDGQASYISKQGYSTHEIRIDLRDAFIFATMNFSVDRFGFEADPRLTTIDNVRAAWKRLSSRVSDVKSVLGTMFLPETVSRLLSKFHILEPLTEEGYRKVIELNIATAARERLMDKQGRNRAAVELKTTPAYREYLFREAVIPSEGARHTVVTTQSRVTSHLELALKNIKKNSPYAADPVFITLDFRPKSDTVVAWMERESPQAGDSRVKLYEREIALAFPPLDIKGKIPADRLRTSVHEFGHAYSAIRLGLRIEYIAVVSPSEGIGGYVKYNSGGGHSAKELLARVYSALASRAMERIFLSEDPLRSRSVIDITAGPSQDIKQASMTLYNMLFELGFNPRGGTIDQMGVINGNPYANFESIPYEIVEKLGLVLREMEDQVLRDFLKAQSREWYIDKISQLARQGGMNEKEFFELLELKHPGRVNASMQGYSKLYEYFSKVVQQPNAEHRKATEYRVGSDGRSAPQVVEAFVDEFLDILRRNGMEPAQSLEQKKPASNTRRDLEQRKHDIEESIRLGVAKGLSRCAAVMAIAAGG